MSTLHVVTMQTRKILTLLFLLIVGIFALMLLINLGKFVLGVLFPTPPPAPTVSFGKLPVINFPDSQQGNFTYSLNTLSGDLPVFPDRAKVFKLQQPQPDLLALDKAKEKVKLIGFTTDPVALSTTKYEWLNIDDLTKTFILNIFTYDFILTSPYATNPSVEAATNLPDQNGAIDMVNNFLSTFTITASDIDSGKTKVSIFTLNNGDIIPATSLSESQIVRVDLFQKDIDGLPIYYDKPSYSSMNFLVGGGQNEGQLVEANFMHKTITQTFGTYPIITPQQAFTLLKQGKAYIATNNPSQTAVIIRNVYLAYFLGNSVQDYLEPIVVFQGDNGFFAYVSAIRDEWVNR